MHDDSFDDFNDLELADEVDFLRASHRNLDAHLSDRVFAISETDDTHQSVSEGFREVLDEETSLNKNAAASARLGAMAKAKPQSASSSGQNDSLLSGNFNCDIVVAHALNSLEPDRVEHFWEKGFWSNVFTDGNPVDSMFPKGLKRPLAFFEPSMDGMSEDAVDVVREPKFASRQCSITREYDSCLILTRRVCPMVSEIQLMSRSSKLPSLCTVSMRTFFSGNISVSCETSCHVM